jgi:hypothetical protein
MATTVVVTLPKITVAAETAFTVTALREFVTTSLSDAALQTFLDAAFAAIDDAVGPLEDVREILPTGSGDLLILARRADSIVSVTEDARWSPLVLDATDYELTRSGQTLVRLSTGTNPGWYWHGRVDVTYRPYADMANRIRVAVELVKLELATAGGLTAQAIGSWSETYASGTAHAEQRAEILASLNPGMAMF